MNWYKNSHTFADEEMTDKIEGKGVDNASDKMMDVEMSVAVTNSTLMSDSSNFEEISNNDDKKYVYRSISQTHKKAFNLMWNVIELLEFDGEKSFELCKAFLTVIKDKSMKGFGQAMAVCSMTQLRLLFYNEFLLNPSLGFQLTQHLLSILLENAAYVRNQLGEILEKLEVGMIEVATTDVMELIHTFDMQLDEYDLTQMMENWVYLLTNISQPETQLHQFVNSRLADYIQVDKTQTCWKKLQARIKQWETNQYANTT